MHAPFFAARKGLGVGDHPDKRGSLTFRANGNNTANARRHAINIAAQHCAAVVRQHDGDEVARAVEIGNNGIDSDQTLGHA